jgi:hypothetical protein
MVAPSGAIFFGGWQRTVFVAKADSGRGLVSRNRLMDCELRIWHRIGGDWLVSFFSPKNDCYDPQLFESRIP